MLHNSSNKYSINICSLTGKSTRAKLASRVLFQRPAYYLPETILQQHVRERVFPDRKLRKRAPDNDCSCFRNPNATKYVAWLQRMKQRTLSPLPLGIAGMILSEQTNTTTLNTLHGVRHSLLSSSSSTCLLGRTPCITSSSLRPNSLFLFWPPLSVGWGPFCPGRDLILAPPCPVSPSLILFTWVFIFHWRICP